MDIKILVATHKKYWMPDDDVYLPIHVGREGKQDLGYVGDNTGDNISIKNANYCELTGLYWAWKNLDCEYIGLCHYRRYFGKSGKFISYMCEEKDRILTYHEYKEALKTCDILLPTVSKLKQTIGQQYAASHNYEDLLKVREIISSNYSEYVDSFDYITNQNKVYFANMFVMKKTVFDKYCQWLFSILFELEKAIDISKYDTYQARVFGFLSERMFSVWLHKHNYKIKETDVIFLEKKVKWKRKICRRLLRALGV